MTISTTPAGVTLAKATDGRRPFGCDRFGHRRALAPREAQTLIRQMPADEMTDISR